MNFFFYLGKFDLLLMYYQLRRGSRQKPSPLRISFKRYSTIWRLICATFMKTINFAISFPVVVLLFLVMPITLVFKWIVSLAHRMACLGGNILFRTITLTQTKEYLWMFKHRKYFFCTFKIQLKFECRKIHLNYYMLVFIVLMQFIWYFLL